MAQVTKEMLRERFVEAGLETFWPQIAKVLRPAIATKTYRCSDASLGVGTSKRWGAPDVPPDFIWPERGGKPCDFLCQINLAEAAPFDVEGLLPKAGLLSFFLTSYEVGWEGALNGDPVYFFPPEVPLERRGESDTAAQVSFDYIWTAPDNSAKLDFLGRRSETEKAYERVIHSLSDMTGGGVFETVAAMSVIQGETTLSEIFSSLLKPPDQPFDPLLGCINLGGDCLLGYPNDYQGDQEPTCELIYHGIIKNSYEDVPENGASLYAEVKQVAFDNWLCLFDTSDDVGVFSLSYCIRRDDLARHDFSKTILIAVN